MTTTATPKAMESQIFPPGPDAVAEFQGQRQGQHNDEDDEGENDFTVKNRQDLPQAISQ